MNKSTWLLIGLCALASLAFIAGGGLLIKPLTPAPATAQATRNKRLHEVPKIVTKTRSLQVARTEIVPLGSDDLLRLTLHNDSEKTIVSFSICTMLDEYGRSSMTYYGPDETDEAVAPYGERTVDILAWALKPGKPLFICAATFADGTQEGVERILKSDKESYEEMKKERRNRAMG